MFYMKIFCLLFSIIISADLELKSSNGKIYILHDNGTWSEKEIKINSDSSIECTYSEDTIDSFSGSHIRRSSSFTLGKTTLGKKPKFIIGEVKNDNDGAHVAQLTLTNFGDLGCMSPSAKLKFKLIDGSFIEIKYRGDIDCSEYAPLSIQLFAGCNEVVSKYFGAPSYEDLNKLKTIPIEMIRITGGDYYTDLTIDDDKKTLLSNYLKCFEFNCEKEN